MMEKIRKIMSFLLCIAGLLAAGLGLAVKMGARGGKRAASIAVIGGADGPTSIFLAGKVSNGAVVVLFLSGVILLVLAALLFYRHRG